ncbi:MAG: PqqD family protein [Clostridia bacterium]|nr:PqqD family protein [Clostridia bacterium]
MKIKDGFILRKVAGNYIVIGVGQEAVDFNGMITINETGAFLWEVLSKGATKEEMLSALLAEYDVDEETAKKDITEFLIKLNDGKLLIVNE